DAALVTTTPSATTATTTTTATTPVSSPTPLDKPDDDDPPLPSPEEMVEATRLLVLHEERMRALDAQARLERDDYIHRLSRVEDRCTALALVAPIRDRQTP